MGKDVPDALYTYGLYDFLGQQILPFEYSFLVEAESGIYCRKENENGETVHGIYDLKQGFIIPVKYCLLSEYDFDFFLASENCVDYKFIYPQHPDKNQLILPTQYFPDSDIAKIEKEGKIGLFFATSGSFTGAIYDSIATFGDDFLVSNGGQLGLIDGYKGWPFIDLKYDTISMVGSEAIMVQKGQKFGLFHLDGRTIYRCVLDEIIFSDSSDYTILRRENLYAVINKNFVDVFYPKYKAVKVSRESIILVADEKWGMVNEKGESVTELIYDALSFEIPGLLRAELDGKIGILNTAGKIMLPIIFDKIKFIKSDVKGNSIWLVQIANYAFQLDSKGHCVKDCPETNKLEKWGLK